MHYRTLGRTGLRISEVSLGSWLTCVNPTEKKATSDVVHRALDLGINHIDTADIYGNGVAEAVLGEILEGVRRSSYIIASKVFWPTGSGPNDKGLSRKHIHETVDASLRRLKTDYLDILYCHRYDTSVPLEETVTAMEDLVVQGRILYWGVSCWTAKQIARACRLATRHKPAVDQPPYNVFDRHIEQDVLGTCAKEGLGVVVWSPLAQGVLTGKYLKGQPVNSRAADDKLYKLMRRYFEPKCTAAVRELVEIAKDANLTPSQVALGWCLRRDQITSVIVGATHVAQIEENARTAMLPKAVLSAVENVVRSAPTVSATDPL